MDEFQTWLYKKNSSAKNAEDKIQTESIGTIS